MNKMIDFASRIFDRMPENVDRFSFSLGWRPRKTLEEKDRTICKLDSEKFYLGQRVFDLSGVEESFWSDETLVRHFFSLLLPFISSITGNLIP